MVICAASNRRNCRLLDKKFARNGSVIFVSGSIIEEKKAAGLGSFDLVLIDKHMPDDNGTTEALIGAKSVLIRNINTYPGFELTRTLLSHKYNLVDENLSGA